MTTDSLNRYYFPIHPIPYRDEYLLSYIYRLSEDNSIPLSYLLGNNNRTNIIRDAEKDSFDRLSAITGFENSVFRNMNLRKLPLLEDSSPFFPTYTEHDITIRVCPLCLKEKQYYKLHWKNRLSFICTEHHILLIDRCGKCGSIIRDRYNSVRLLPIGICDNCKDHFSESKQIISCNSEAAEFQRQLLHFIENPFSRSIGDHEVSAASFIKLFVFFYFLSAYAGINSPYSYKNHLPIPTIKAVFGQVSYRKWDQYSDTNNVYSDSTFALSAYLALTDFYQSFPVLLDHASEYFSHYVSPVKRHCSSCITYRVSELARWNQLPFFVKEEYSKWFMNKKPYIPRKRSYSDCLSRCIFQHGYGYRLD